MDGLLISSVAVQELGTTGSRTGKPLGFGDATDSILTSAGCGIRLACDAGFLASWMEPQTGQSAMNPRIRLMVGAAIFVLVFGSATCGHGANPEAPPFFPARDAPNSEGLVSATWLKAVFDFHQSSFQSPRPPSYRNDHHVVLEASWAHLDRAEDYRRGHIPGAIHFNTDEIEDGHPTWKLRSPRELQEVIGRHGITPQTTVIVYGKQLVAAARVWWALKYAGVTDVRLLDGGFEMWTALGHPRETTIHTPKPLLFSAQVNTHLLATTDEVRATLDGPQVWLADARSEAEFTGRKSGYKYLDCKGRIPGAIPIGDADDGSALHKLRDGRLRDPSEIAALWRKHGIVSTKNPGSFDREVIFYCGGGWRSSLAFYYAWLLGYQNIRNYSDGWGGWSTEYVADPAAKGGTPGWRQQRTANPIQLLEARGRLVEIANGWSTEIVRSVASTSLLLLLLAWESFAPFFAFFHNATGERLRHGLRNLTLSVLNAALIVLTCFGLWWTVSQWTEENSFGLLHWFRLPGWAHWAGVFLLLDLWMYAWHRLNHRLPFLWRFHRVHHSDARMDVTTANRFHIGEVAMSCLFLTPVMALLGLQLTELAAYQLVMFSVVQMHHANVRLPAIAERLLQFVIVTPFMHKVHHSNWRPETDSNYSSLFSFWDRLFHTFRWLNDPQTLRLGLDELGADKHQTLGGLLATPARRLERSPTAQFRSDQGISTTR